MDILDVPPRKLHIPLLALCPTSQLLLVLLLKCITWKCLQSITLGHWKCPASWMNWKCRKVYTHFHSHSSPIFLLIHSQWLTGVRIQKSRSFAGKTLWCTPEFPCGLCWVWDLSWSSIFTWGCPSLPCFPTPPTSQWFLLEAYV